jgi:hypothetical protein
LSVRDLGHQGGTLKREVVWVLFDNQHRSSNGSLLAMWMVRGLTVGGPSVNLDFGSGHSLSGIWRHRDGNVTLPSSRFVGILDGTGEDPSESSTL